MRSVSLVFRWAVIAHGQSGCRLWLLLAVAMILATGLPAGEIHVAAEQGDLAKVKALVAANPDCVNERDREQKTPLHYAAYGGQLAVAEFLVAAKADINARSSQGITPTYLARGMGKTAVAQLLAKHGGTIEIIKPTRPKTTPKEPTVPVKPLGVPPPVAPPRSDPGIIQAARTNGLGAIKALLAVNPAAVQDTDGNRWTALHHAAEMGHAQAAALLLQNGAAVDARAAEDVTPLHIAARRGDQAMVALLLSQKANANARTMIQATPLMLVAAAGKMPDMVRLLLKGGADVNARDQYGNSALTLAAAVPQADGVAEILVQAGAAINTQETASGFGALHHAVLRGHRNLVRTLLAAKANPNLSTTDGETPLSLALYEGQADIATQLRASGAQLPPEPKLSPLESNLVDFYRGYYEKLATATYADLRKILSERLPAQPEISQIFLRGAPAVWQKVEEIQRHETVAWGTANRNPEDREKFLVMARNGARAGDFLRLHPRPPSDFVRAAKAQRLIPAELPVYQLEVRRRGGEKLMEGDFYRVGERWVILPPMSHVFPELSP